LTAKGSVKLDGIPAQRALIIADHFGKLGLERRVLMALKAMNDPSVPENRELLQAIAWSHPALEVVTSRYASPNSGRVGRRERPG
jgi:2-keto-4-pentenoate hydratase